MAQQNSETADTFFARYQIPIIIAAIILIAGVLYAVNRDKNTNDQKPNDQTSQDSSQNPTLNPGTDPGKIDGANTEAPTPAPAQGNVAAAGTLKVSDNKAKGNYMVDSSKGKIYIATKRDFSSLVDKQVTLNAEGNLNNFKFIGFNESMGTDTTAMGGNPDQAPATGVSFSGTLKTSDNGSMGNYVIVSGNTKVYLKTAHNYSAWVGTEVKLAATGTLKSFTNATVTKK